MHDPPSVPETLVRSTVELRGEAGVEWLKGIPALVAQLEHRWSLETGPPFPEIWINWVAPASSADGASVVLKLSFPEDKEFKTEAEALRVFNGRGITKLLRACANRSWATVGSAIPTVVDSCFSDESTHHYDHLGEGNSEVDDPPSALGAPRQFLVGVVPGVGAFNHPTFRCS